MISTPSFSSIRFWKILRKEVLENAKSWFLRIGVLFGLMAIILIWNASYYYNSADVYYIQSRIISFGIDLFIFGFLVIGIGSASFLMSNMQTKEKIIRTLMLPASSLEKFLVRCFLYAVCPLLVFIVVFKMADYARTLFYWFLFPSEETVGSIPILEYMIRNQEHWGIFDSMSCAISGMLAFLFIQSFFALGSCIWPKNAFQKTFAAAFVLLVSYFMFGSFLFEEIFSTRYWSYGDSCQEIILLWFTILMGLFTIINWIIAYYRFKESEIINRW